MARMFALLTRDGTATSETALCDRCRPVFEQYARDRADLSDTNPDGPFEDVTENDALVCSGCDVQIDVRGYDTEIEALAFYEGLMQAGNGAGRSLFDAEVVGKQVYFRDSGY